MAPHRSMTQIRSVGLDPNDLLGPMRASKPYAAA